MTLNEMLALLGNVTKSGSGYAASCPAHEDAKQHLTVTEAEDGRILLHCHRGCAFREIMESLDLEVKDAFPKSIKNGDVREFHIRDASGNKLATHHRKDEGGKKRVWWTDASGKGGLGGMSGSSLPLWGTEAIGSVPLNEPIVVVEGEKAAFYLTYNGIPALGTVTGASGTPGEEALSPLSGRQVVLWPDRDDEGEKHMRRIASGLAALGIEARLFEWAEAPEKGDAADHPAVRRSDAQALRKLREELSAAPLYEEPRDRTLASSVEYLRERFLDWVAGKEGDIDGIRTGIPKVDKKILGLSSGRSYVIAGQPGAGKSLLSGQIALTAAYQHKRVLMHSIESSALEYVQRMTCYMAGVDYFRAISKKTTTGERARLKVEFEKLAEMPFLITDLGTQKPSYIRRQVELHQPDLVVIDYLQYATPENPTGNPVQDLDVLSKELTAIKSDYGVPVVLAAQISRESRHGNAEPELHSLRGSGALEQDADVVMFLHADKPDEKEVAGVKLLCKKNRISKTFNERLYFVPGQQWFTDGSEVLSPGLGPDSIDVGLGPGVRRRTTA